jgi:DNA polymerase III subunit beta
MKFSCTQENLNQGLSVVSHIASKNVNLPILGNVLIKCDGNVLKLLSTNLEIAISCSVRGKIEVPGEFTVPSKLFSDYVNLLSKDRIDVEQNGSLIEVSCGSYKTKLNGVHAAEFPLIPSVDKRQKFTVNVSDLRRAISQVLFAVAPNESRPEISGVLFAFVQEKKTISLTLAATDSYRLAERAVKASGGSGEGRTAVIVPSRTVAELMRILTVFKDDAESPADVDVFLSDNQILFSYGPVELISRTIEGKYPDYRQLVPESYQTELRISKDELQRAVKATSLFSRTGLNDITLNAASNGTVNVRANNSQTGEHTVDLEGAVVGKDNVITVNYKYLLDGVNNIDAETVALKLIDGMSPCVIQGGSDEEPSDYLYIVMPIRQ